jgi:hypothetical protein
MARSFRAKLSAHIALAALDLLAIEGLLRLEEVRWGLLRCAPGSYAAPARGPRIAFVGDSTMVGTNVPPDRTLPSAFAAIAREAGVEPITVWNLARPGGIVASAVDDALKALRTLSPTAIVLRAGSIDIVVADPTPRPQPRSLRIVDALRRCVSVVRGPDESQESRPVSQWLSVGPRSAELANLGIDVSRTISWLPTDISYEKDAIATVDELAARLTDRLRPLAEATRRAGVPLVLVGYLETRGFPGPATVALRSASKALGVPLVDLERLCSPLFEIVAADELLASDGHPRAFEYGIEARALLDELAPALGLPRPAGATPQMWLSAEVARLRRENPNFQPPLAPHVSLQIERKESGIVFLVHGQPGAEVWLLAGKPGPPWDYYGWPLPIDREQAIAAGASPSTHFNLDADGSARVELPETWVSELGEGAAAVACSTWMLGGQTRRNISDLVRISDGSTEAIRRR